MKIVLNKKLFYFLVIILVNIFASNINYETKNVYQSNAETGIYDGENQFFYFKYYLDIFPLKYTKLLNKNDLSKEAAKKKLEEVENLVMEESHQIRFGGFNSIYLFYPDALLFGKIINPSIKTFNIIFFNFSLIFLFFSFCYTNKSTQGFVLCILLSSNPFQIFELYHNDNVFSLVISINIFLASMFIFFSSKLKETKNNVYLFIYIIISVFLIIFFYYVRDNLILFILPVFFSIFFFKAKMIIKFLGIILFVISTIFINSEISNSIKNNFDNTIDLLATQNGKYLDVPYSLHETYFPIYSGLNEFKSDLDIGFWSDEAADQLLKNKYNIDISVVMSKKSKNGYNIHPVGEIPYYDNYFKDEITNIFLENKILFLKIIIDRLSTSLNNLTPLSINFLLKNISLDYKLVNKFLLIIYFFLIIHIIRNKDFENLYLFILGSTYFIYCLIFPATLGISYYILSHIFLFNLFLKKIFNYDE